MERGNRFSFACNSTSVRTQQRETLSPRDPNDAKLASHITQRVARIRLQVVRFNPYLIATSGEASGPISTA